MKSTQILGLILVLGTAVSAHAEDKTYTVGTYCDLLQSTKFNFKSNPDAVASLQADYDRVCQFMGARNSTSEYKGEINQFISSNPSDTRGEFEMKNITESPGNQADIGSKYEQVRVAAGELLAECLARAGRSNNGPKTKFTDLISQMQGAEAQVEQACQNIPSFQSTADQALDTTVQECTTIQKKCSEMVNGVDEYYRELRGKGTMTQAMSYQRAIAYNACNTMVESAKQAAMDPSQARFDLNNSCSKARERIAAAKAKPKDEVAGTKPKAETTAKTPSVWDQAAAALPTLMNMYDQANQEPMDLSTDYANGTQVQVPSNYTDNSYTAPNNLGAVKGVDGVTTKSAYDASTLDLGMDESMPIDPANRSKNGQFAQGPGGMAGAVQNSGSSARAGGADAKGRGRTRGNGFETGVYAGAYGSGAGGSRVRGGDGYPEVQGQQRGGLAARGGVPVDARVRAMNDSLQNGMRDLRRFLPAYNMGRRPTAATGPDGITGPHSNLFSKISNRYKFVPVEMGPFAPRK